MPKKPSPADATMQYRSGAVAKLTGIPVQTLRVWERRYKIVGPRVSETGQRLYTTQEVERLGIIKRLVSIGHAIGSIATLNIAQLETLLDETLRVSAKYPSTNNSGPLARTQPVRLAIIGEALAIRIDRNPAQTSQIVATCPEFTKADEVLKGVVADVLLIELPTLRRDTAIAASRLAQLVGARQIIIEFGYTTHQLEQDLRARGMILVQAPLSTEQLEILCNALLSAQPNTDGRELFEAGVVAPRRFSNRLLTEISTTSVTLSCECPRHITDLLIRLNNFESYSAECVNRNPDDAKLHRYLKQATGHARATLETALDHLMATEGILLSDDQLVRQQQPLPPDPNLPSNR